MVQSWKQVFEQDVPIARYVHRNHKLRDHVGLGTRMAPAWEEGVASFYRSLLAVMGAKSAPGFRGIDCRDGRNFGTRLGSRDAE
jgi:hypothetical protein